MTTHPPRDDPRLPDEIRTERLILRPYMPEDAEALFEAVEETRERLREWMRWADGFRRR